MEPTERSAATVVMTAGFYRLYPNGWWRILADGRCERVSRV